MTAMWTVAALHTPTLPDRAESLQQVCGTLGASARAGAFLAVLPELFTWPYFGSEDPASWQDVAESLEGPTVDWARSCARLHGLHIVVPLPLRDGPFCRNAAVLVRADGTAEIAAAKIHLPKQGTEAFGEEDHFVAGDPVVPIVDVGGLRFAVLICYDRRFPECWLAARAGGADLVLVPVAGPADEPADLFAAQMRTHAHENGLYALSAAKCGLDQLGARSVRNNGETLAVGPDGAVVSRLTQADGPGFILLAIDRPALAQARARFPGFDQMRPVTPRAGHMGEQS